jgi:hypothetical protein
MCLCVCVCVCVRESVSLSLPVYNERCTCTNTPHSSQTGVCPSLSVWASLSTHKPITNINPQWAAVCASLINTD